MNPKVGTELIHTLGDNQKVQCTNKDVLNKNYDLLQECGLPLIETNIIYKKLKEQLIVQIDKFYEHSKNEEETMIEDYFS